MIIRQEEFEYLKNMVTRVLDACSTKTTIEIEGIEEAIALHVPSGDMKYKSFWIRDSAMMAECGMITSDEIKGWLRLIAYKGQNESVEINLKNGLKVPPWSIADHINFDGGAVFYPGTYNSGDDQGKGNFGFLPPHDNQYYFIEMAYIYYNLSKDLTLFNEVVKGFSYILYVKSST